MPSAGITFFQTPDIAENGAVVPIGVTSTIPKTESIAILIEKNPNMLAAVFDIPAGTEPSISTRIKMAQTSNVFALVKAGGKLFRGLEGDQGHARRLRRLTAGVAPPFDRRSHVRSDACPRQPGR